MNDPSPYSHLYRLGGLLVVGLIGFLVVREVAAPANFSYDIDNWYRLDALEELKQQPMIFGGIEDVAYAKRNESCQACHLEIEEKYRKFKHKGVSCEVCHGPLFDHVEEGKKIADAIVITDERVVWTCKNCHLGMINKPKRMAQFITAERYVKHIAFEAGELEPGTVCLKCHNPHDPSP